MIALNKPCTVEDFETFCDLPENSDRLFEFIGGEIVEKVPSNPQSSKIASRFNRFIGNYVDEHNLGHVTGEAGGYQVAGERYAPDVAFVAYERQAELAKHGYNPVAPDLAVEVISPTDNLKKVMIKAGNYLAAGTVVWLAYPDTPSVDVYAPLPGFSVAISAIFK